MRKVQLQTDVGNDGGNKPLDGNTWLRFGHRACTLTALPDNLARHKIRIANIPADRDACPPLSCAAIKSPAAVFRRRKLRFKFTAPQKGEVICIQNF